MGRLIASVIRDLVLVLAGAAALLALLQKFISRPGKGTGGKSKGAGGLWGDPEAAAEGDEGLEATLPRGSRRRAVATLYVKLLDKLGRLGLRRSESQTGREFALSLERTVAPCPAELRELTAFFEDVRYGGLEPTEEELTRFKEISQRALKDMKRAQANLRTP